MAWWPPTLIPVRLGRFRLAWSTIAVNHHRTGLSIPCMSGRFRSARGVASLSQSRLLDDCR